MRLGRSSAIRIRVAAPLLRRALLRPEPLLSLLVFVAAGAFFASGLGSRRPPPAQIEINAAEAPAVEFREVRLVRYDEGGLEAPTYARVALPEAPGERLEAILAALREALLEAEWPEALPTPTVFIESVGRERVAVLDFRTRGPLPLTVAAESRLLASVRETVLANGADQIRFLLNGEAAGVFLEHLAVPAAL